MADISTQLKAILSARYGEEVRGSIHDAIEKINEVVENSDPAVIARLAVRSYEKYINGTTVKEYPSADDLPGNSVFGVTNAGLTGGFQNAPFNSGHTIISFDWNYGGKSPIMQVSIPFQDTGIAFRTRVNGVWNEWTYIMVENEFDYLEPSGTNDTSAMNIKLRDEGLCLLGEGDYYVRNLKMQKHSTIRGIGNKTRIHLIDDPDATFALGLHEGVRIEDVQIIGDESFSPDGNIKEKHGILALGDSSPTEYFRAYVSNVTIQGFSGGGITLNQTGYDSASSANIVNCYIHNCNVGVYIPYWSEYHRITNVNCDYCYYGSINNGGNNVFTNCGFNNNILGMWFDNSSGQSKNNTHGSIVGCTFNHENQNEGISVKMEGTTSGESFVGCQFFYGKTELKNVNNIIFSACNYGTASGISVEGNGLVIFDSCVFHSKEETPITIIDNTRVKIVNTYYRNSQNVVNEYSGILTGFDLNITSDNYESELSSFDNAPINSIYAITSVVDKIANHPPTDRASGTLITVKPRPATPSKSFSVQMFVDLGNNLFMRSCWSSNWTDWILMNSDSYKPINDSSRYFVSTCVDKSKVKLDDKTDILLFGDSIANASGDQNWIYKISTSTGSKYTKHCKSGSLFGHQDPERGSEYWISTKIDGTPDEEWNKATLVMVAGGTNDAGHGTSEAELRLRVQEIITTIKSKTSAPILFITPIRRGDNDQYLNVLPKVSGVISNVALENECSVINGFDFPIATYTNGSINNMTVDGLHPNGIGAYVYATSVMNAIM